jgi:Fe-S cluster biosynthesis and repair protein YggX
MLKLTVNSKVLEKLSKAFSKPQASAQKALDKYMAKLEEMLNEALVLGQTEYERKLDLYSIKVNDLRRACRIGSDKKWLHDWLIDNKLDLIKIAEKGSNLNGLKSVISLTDLVTIEEKLELEDSLLDENSKVELAEFYSHLANLSEAQIHEQYDIATIDIESVEAYFEWLTTQAKLLSEKQLKSYKRNAIHILKVARFSDGIYLQKKIKSDFGRTYYEGVSVQSVNKELRRAMLGNSWEYDIKSSVITWKMGFARECQKASKSTRTFEKDFFETLLYLEDKKDFMLTVRNNTFNNDEKFSKEQQEKMIKQAVTAICFGATVRAHGWRDKSGHWQYASINSIIKDVECRKRFTKSITVKHFISQQKQLDDFIFEKMKKQKPQLLTKKILTTASGRISKAKFLAHEYQHAETEIMDVVRAELAEMGHDLLASIHDAIVIRNKLTKNQKSKIEDLMRQSTQNEHWSLGEKQLLRYNTVNKQALEEEWAHKQFIAEQEKLAIGYKSKIGAN